MVLKRIIPSLLYNRNGLVKTTNFKNPVYIGDPINSIRIFNNKKVDEISIIDIEASKRGLKPDFKKISECASECFSPMSYGGGVKSMDDFYQLFKSGIEKVAVNTLIIENPELVILAVKEFGSSSIIGSVDVKSNVFNKQKVYGYKGTKFGKSVSSYCKYLSEDIGVGELLLTSVNREGTWKGADISMINEITNAIKIPVVYSGGINSIDNINEVFNLGRISGVAIGNMAVYQKKGMGVLLSYPDEKLINRN